MKNFKLSIAYLAVFALIFTSCSKEEAGVQDMDSDKATLSFGAIVNDLASKASKQAASDIPECTDDTPSYVEIVLMQGDNEIVGTSNNPYRVNLAAGQIFTVEDEELELDPGNYTLDHFAVYNQGGDLIWIAPRGGSALGEYVDAALPLAIDLRAGVKKYVDVSVLCFDNREVNEYGYLFFELDTNVALEYCFFANYCDDDGRHYPARYSVNIWAGTNANGTPLYTGVENNVGIHDNGDFYADPLCFALPDNDDVNEDYLYYEVTVLDWADAYGDVEQRTITGTISKQDILDNDVNPNDDNIEYNHLRFCDDAGEIVDPVDPEPVSDCIPTPGAGCDTLMFEQTVDIAGFPATVDDPFYPLTVNGETVGTITFVLASLGDDVLEVNLDLNEGLSFTDVEVSLPDFVDTQICVQNITENDFQVLYEVDAEVYPDGIAWPVDVEFAANICD